MEKLMIVILSVFVTVTATVIDTIIGIPCLFFIKKKR